MQIIKSVVVVPINADQTRWRCTINLMLNEQRRQVIGEGRDSDEAMEDATTEIECLLDSVIL